MADKSVDLGASNLVSLGANFKAQNSASPHSRTPATVIDADGSVACETMTGGITNYTNSFGYCNDTPNIKTDLAANLTAFGTVVDSKMIEEIAIAFEKGVQATVDVTSHNHDDNAHAGTDAGVADVSAAVPASSGFGCPDFGITLGTDATVISASLTINWRTHVDEDGADGGHWAGKNLGPQATVSIEILGLPTSQTEAALETAMTGWTMDSVGPADDNATLDRFMITAHQYFSMT